MIANAIADGDRDVTRCRLAACRCGDAPWRDGTAEAAAHGTIVDALTSLATS